MIHRLFLFLLLITIALLPVAAQEDEGQPPTRTPQPLALGETVTATFADRVVHTVELEAAQTVYIDVVSEIPLDIRADKNFVAPTVENADTPEPDANGVSRVEFNAPSDGTYGFLTFVRKNEITDEDLASSYSITVTYVPQVEAALGDTLTIPEGADSPFYALFSIEIGQHVQVTTETPGVLIRGEDAGGATDGLNALDLIWEATQRHEPPFDMAPLIGGTHRIVVFAPNDAPTFPTETTITLVSLPTYTEEIDYGRHGVTSDRLTTFTIQLDQYEAVTFQMETDYHAWMTIIDPDVGVLYRSGHVASGSTSAAHTIVAAEAGPIHVRISVNSGVTANGTSILTVERIRTELLTLGETMGFPRGGSSGLVAADLEAGQSYRIEISAANDGYVNVSAATVIAGPVLPPIELRDTQGAVRIWTAKTTGRAFFRVSTHEDTRLVQLTISEVDE